MDKVIVGLLILLVVWIAGSCFQILHNNKEYDLACEELGFEDYKNIDGMRYCEDTENNLHYIKMECKTWYWISCTAKPISVGDVRVK